MKLKNKTKQELFFFLGLKLIRVGLLKSQGSKCLDTLISLFKVFVISFKESPSECTSSVYSYITKSNEPWHSTSY